ncbi:MAG: VWA domain-containing protein, partial [Proteobacteria bacterium]|nr:VWA domain-containing protein [Pseudomonadota bacterium]
MTYNINNSHTGVIGNNIMVKGGINFHPPRILELIIIVSCGIVVMVLWIFIIEPQRYDYDSYEFILDCSNKTNDKYFIHNLKFIKTFINNFLTDSHKLGLRIFGGSCNDPKNNTKLLVNLGYNKSKVDSYLSLEKIKPGLGDSALVNALIKAVQDFRNIKGGKIVLVTGSCDACSKDSLEHLTFFLKQTFIEKEITPTIYLVGGKLDIKCKQHLETIANSSNGFIEARHVFYIDDYSENNIKEVQKKIIKRPLNYLNVKLLDEPPDGRNLLSSLQKRNSKLLDDLPDRRNLLSGLQKRNSKLLDALPDRRNLLNGLQKRNSKLLDDLSDRRNLLSGLQKRNSKLLDDLPDRRNLLSGLQKRNSKL